MKLEIKNRLHSFSYSIDTSDNFLIDTLLNKVTEEIRGEIGKSFIPSEIETFVIDRICGLFLQEKSLKNELGDFDEEYAVSSISEGDLSLSFTTKESKSKQLINYLINKDFDLSPYRSIVW